MGFLAPAMLLAGLAAALPVYLHLLRRHRSTAREFSSLMFFEARQPTTIERRRLRYWLLLALRLALVLLLAIAFAEPYVLRLTAGAGEAPLLLIAIDDSFSMRAGDHLAEAQRAARALLARKSPAQRAEVLGLGAQPQVLAAPSADLRTLSAAIDSMAATDARGSLGGLAAAARSLAAGADAPIELHLFGDLQQTSLPTSFNELTLPRGVRLVLHRSGGAGAALPNWAVTGVAAPARVWSAQEARVEVSVAGYATPAAVRTVSLWVNGQVVASRSVSLAANGRAVVELQPPQLPHGVSRCAARIDSADALKEDDEYRFTIERPEAMRGLLLHEAVDERSPRYLKSALDAAAGQAVRLETLTPDAAADVDLSAYAFVVLDDLAQLPGPLEQHLMSFVRAGGSALAALGTAAAQRSTTPLLGARLEGGRHYASDSQSFATVGRLDAAHPVVADSAAAWQRVRFYFATVTDPQGLTVVAALADGTPLILERALGEGRVLLWASGFDGLTNDLPLQPLFVAFLDRALRYVTRTEAGRNAYTVGDFATLRRATERRAAVELVDPAGARPLTLEESTTAQAYPLTLGGFYELRRADGRRETLAVNPDRRESDLTPIPAETLALWQGAPTPSGAEPRQASATAAPEPRATRAAVARSLGWYDMLLVLAAALAESIVASRHLGTRRDQL